MKRLLLLPFLLFQLALSFGQVPDTAKRVENIDALAKHGVLFVMDGMALQKPYNLNPESIVDITIIKRDKAKEWFEGDAKIGVVVMISRRRAIADYQKKLSALSKAYKKYLDSYQKRFSLVSEANKKYLEAHDYNETDLLYVLNGKPLESGEKATIQRLYKIPSDSIKEVRFIKEGVKSYEGNRSFLVIITKD